MAACQLLLTHIRAGRVDDADAVFTVLESSHGRDRLPRLIPEADRRRLLAHYSGSGAGMVDRRLTKVQLVQLLAAWKGISNFLGWGGITPSLDPPFRAPLAYVMGRYRALGKLREAADLFATAAADAPGDSPVWRLAEHERAADGGVAGCGDAAHAE